MLNRSAHDHFFQFAQYSKSSQDFFSKIRSNYNAILKSHGMPSRFQPAQCALAILQPRAEWQEASRQDRALNAITLRMKQGLTIDQDRIGSMRDQVGGMKIDSPKTVQEI